VACTAAVLLLCSSCGSDPSCQPRREPSTCADLLYGGHEYEEWRPVERDLGILQEIGDGTYPVCNAVASCRDDGLNGQGQTDIWRLEGVAPGRAVLGLRENTDVRVIFVRRGVDPATVRAPS
jgi:hypothetical protein